MARTVLTETESRSYRLIWSKSKSRFPNVGKPDKPKRGRQGKPKTKNDPAKVAEATRAYLDKGSSQEEAARAAGLASVQGVKTGAAYESGARDMLAKLLDAAAAKNFSEKGAVKIEDAIRIHKARLEKQFEPRINDEVRRRIDAADDAARAQNKQLRQENMNLRALVERRKIMTATEFMLVLSCLHPDSRASVSEERLQRAFQIMQPKKFALTGEK